MERKIQIEVPYPVGRQLVRIEFGKDHIDQIDHYIIKEEGTFVVLVLDVTTKPRLSSEISVVKLKQEWREFDEIGDIKISQEFTPEAYLYSLGIPLELVSNEEWYEPKSTVVDDLDGYGKQKRLDR